LDSSTPHRIPLAEILRPKSLDDYIGQQHLAGKETAFRRMIEEGKVHSMLFWGPPGVGKTTLALIIAQSTDRPFYTLSAVNSGVKDVREVIDKAKQDHSQPILFIDEIHRFSKSQQDSLLGAVEKGTVILIGATTENPSFEVISPLLSRCHVYILKSLEEEDLYRILEHARLALETSLGTSIRIEENEALLRISGGDARKLLNAIELVSLALHGKEGEIVINNTNTLSIIQQNLAMYDKSGEMHYDVISAFIKSLRGSDPNAAVYWLARMINAGEDLLFIARRMLILASEDIGNANPNALLLANSCFEAVNKIGFPESRIILSQTAVYLANSAKSNSTYMAIEDALAAIEKHGDLPVPLHLRNAPTKLMKKIGYGKDYQYAHSYDGNFVNLEFLPSKIAGTKFYDPGKNPREAEARELLKQRWKDKYGY
jgi:putative ATPase